MIRRAKPRRKAFTLVELLVVGIIIAVLAALLLPAIQGAMRTARNAAVAGEITTMSQAMASFKEKFGDYPPSRIILSENGRYDIDPTGPAGKMIASANGTGGSDISYAQLAQRSLTYLRKFFPKVRFRTDGNVWVPDDNQWYDFNGDGVFQNDTTRTDGYFGYILEGDECLTFFLGGIPLNTSSAIDPQWSLSGLGKLPTNPFSNNLKNGNPMYNENRTPPFFEFKGDRLRDDDDPAKDPVRWPSYFDTLATDRPFAYFSAYGTEAYDPNDVNYAPLDAAGKPAGAEVDANGAGPVLRPFQVNFPVLDGAAATSRVAISAAPNPYSASLTAAPTTQWQKGQTFQILSAGRDGLYGLGGPHQAGKPVVMPLEDGAGLNTKDPTIRTREADNIANFQAGTLE